MDTQHFDEWTRRTKDADCKSLTPDRLISFFAWTVKYGPANCWTGDSGTAAVIIRELLTERIVLKEQIERLSDELDRLRGVRAEQGTSGAG